MKLMHSDAEGCVHGMVQKSIRMVDNKLNGQHELTIVDPLDINEDVQAELNILAMAADCLAELDKDGDYDVDDVKGEAPAGFQSHEYDESMVLGLMGMIGMTFPEDKNEEL
jgi:hypothetical protein